jgi:hypothetical protein
VFPLADETMLRCYIALDAMRRSAGSSPLFSTLATHLIMAINLCKQGFRVDRFTTIRLAQQGLLAMRRREEPQDWTLEENTYRAICEALGVLDEQLRIAPAAQVNQARNAMLSLLDTVRKAA